MQAKDVRAAFIDYFVKLDHTFVPSSSLVPHDDPTLLFTNAGMNQFKQIFLGKETRDYTRAVNSQKCIRAGGKHNDLEDVGRDGTHLTFFEMLGNWSFGDYYKAEAIEWAWKLLTGVYELDRNRLWATVHHTDDEAAEIWAKVTGLSRDRILKFGDKDNFWEMAEIGPCGPCSEIHYYFGNDPEHQDARLINANHPDYIEIWNNVFIQNNRLWHDPKDTSKGTYLEELPAKHVDTGMGFERLLSILQGKKWIYDTDLFTPILAAISDQFNQQYTLEKGLAHRVVADHIRCLTFAFADGALPSNEDRGYVLRKILRRAVRQGWLQGVREPFLFDLVPIVVKYMGEAFPELKERQSHVTKLIQSEEERFLNTVSRGIEMFHQVVDEIKTRGGRVIPGDLAFRLHDTYGFPLDLTIDLAESEQLSVDRPGFELAMKEQQNRSRATTGFNMEDVAETPWHGHPKSIQTEFVGYDTLEHPAEIKAWRVDPIDPTKVQLILDKTPFYAESGGQVGDQGTLWGPEVEIRVIDTRKRDSLHLHFGRILRGDIEAGEKVTARVDEKLRFATMRNHTATHLLHAALHRVIGNHAQQAGSLVCPDYLRFDFTHYEAVNEHELEQIENLVNQQIIRNRRIQWDSRSLDEAKKAGAMALFGEKYGDTVRVVQIDDFSLELCGGTHLEHTGEIGLFHITTESGIAAGTRRIEAITGEAAYQHFRGQHHLLKRLSQTAKSTIKELPAKFEKLVEENKDLHKEIERLRQKNAGSTMEDLIGNAPDIEGFKVVAQMVEVADMDALRQMADVLREHLQSGVGVLGAVFEDKGTFVCVVTDDLIKNKGLKAGTIVKQVAQLAGGGGGGKPHFAQAGAREIEKMGDALAKTAEIIKKL